jgi:hypothetical protein
VKEALDVSLQQQVEACKGAAWRGRPWPEAERLALRRALEIVEDIFESSAADIDALIHPDSGETE